MRIAFFVVCVIVGVALVGLASPLFLALAVRAPGGQAIALSAVALTITPDGHDRATTGLAHASEMTERRQFFRELALVHYSLGLGPGTATRVRDALFHESTTAWRQSFALSPVDPVGWLLVAQMYYERGKAAEAAAALDWSLRTGHFLNQHTTTRSFLALGVWSLLSEHTRAMLAESIRSVYERRDHGPVLVAWVVELGLQADVAALLSQLEPDGDVLTRRFVSSVAVEKAKRRAALAGTEETSTMRRALATTSLVISLSLPGFSQAMTIADYLESARGDPWAADETSVNDYLVGVLDGLVMLGAIAHEEGVSIFCLPDPKVMTIETASFRAELDAMLAELQVEVPGFETYARTRSLGLAVLQLMAIRHPCNE